MFGIKNYLINNNCIIAFLVGLQCRLNERDDLIDPLTLVLCLFGVQGNHCTECRKVCTESAKGKHY